MLLRLRIKNFLSFKDEIELSMYPGPTQNHLAHIIHRNDSNSLRSAAIYGPNASGKSNFIKAVKFAHDLVLNDVKIEKNIPTRPFKLDTLCYQMPSKFEFEFISQKTKYLYGFEVDSQKIHTEWLYEIKTTTTKKIFERETNEFNKVMIEFGKLKLESPKVGFLKVCLLG
jgi:hypothetical protein